MFNTCHFWCHWNYKRVRIFPYFSIRSIFLRFRNGFHHSFLFHFMQHPMTFSTCKMICYAILKMEHTTFQNKSNILFNRTTQTFKSSWWRVANLNEFGFLLTFLLSYYASGATETHLNPNLTNLRFALLFGYSENRNVLFVCDSETKNAAIKCFSCICLYEEYFTLWTHSPLEATANDRISIYIQNKKWHLSRKVKLKFLCCIFLNIISENVNSILPSTF